MTKKNIEDAEIIREKGTNRSKFFRGQIDKYTWVEAGSSYLPSDMNAAYLYAQLEVADKIYDDRMSTWNTYYENLTPLKEAGYIELPVVPEGCVHNAHMFYIKAKDLEERSTLIKFLKRAGFLLYSTTFLFTEHQPDRSLAASTEKISTQQKRVNVSFVFLFIMV